MNKLMITAMFGMLMLSGCSNAAEHKNAAATKPPVQVKQTADKTFVQDVLKSDQPVLVDFFADWCGPCKMMSPIVDEVAEQYAGKVKVFKVNIDENPEIASALRIDAIPTLVVFKDGRVVTGSQGAIGKAELTALVEKGLLGAVANEKTKPTL